MLQPNFAPLPATRTWYVNTDGGMEWRAGLYQSWEDPDSGDGYLHAPTVGPWTRYRPGATYHQVWNQAVLGPVLPGPDGPRTGVTRTGDRIKVDLSPYGDGAGRAFTVPVTATPAPGATLGRLRTLSVEVSYDDGATWTTAPVVKGDADGRPRLPVRVKQRRFGGLASARRTGVWPHTGGVPRRWSRYLAHPRTVDRHPAVH